MPSTRATHFSGTRSRRRSIYGTHLATPNSPKSDLDGKKTKAELYFGCPRTDILRGRWRSSTGEK